MLYVSSNNQNMNKPAAAWVWWSKSWKLLKNNVKSFITASHRCKSTKHCILSNVRGQKMLKKVRTVDVFITILDHNVGCNIHFAPYPNRYVNLESYPVLLFTNLHDITE